MSYHYVVTAHKPTNVTHAVVANVTGPDDLNLIVCKCTHLEIYTLAGDTLQPVYDIPLYARVETLQAWRPGHERVDLLFLTTARYQFALLAFDPSTGQLVTRAEGDLQDRVGRPAEHGQIALIDPDSRVIGLRLYDGLLKVLPLAPTALTAAGAAAAAAAAPAHLRDSFNVRLEEQQVIDLAFLHGGARPTLAVLSQDAKEARSVKTYEVVVREREIIDGPWSQDHLEGGASMLQPVPSPWGGVLIIGEQTITYHSGSTFCSIMMRPTIVRACGKVDADGRRWLLGDDRGALSVLVLHTSMPADGGAGGSSSAGAAPLRGQVESLQLEPLGVTSCPSALCYLTDGIIFVGSSYGDSQLIRLQQPSAGPAGSAAGAAGGGTMIQVLDTMTNLGPVIDFCVVDLERQGQGQVVCCSGAFKDGSLRIMRNGIGIDEHASVALPSIKGMWALRNGSDAVHDVALVLTFMHETRVLAMRGEELEEADPGGLDARAKTLLCTNMLGETILQVCVSQVTLVAAASLAPLATWHPPPGRHISVAAADGTDVVVALSAPSELVLLRAADGALVAVASTSLEHEASCLALSDPTYGRGGPVAGWQPGQSRVVAVGLWTRMDVLLLELPTLQLMRAEPLLGDVMPRSLLFVAFERGNYLLCGMGDGHLISYCFHSSAPGLAPALSERKQVPLGTQPVQLTPFICKGARHVFCASDRPSVVSSSTYKLLIANVNLRDTTCMSPFDAAAFPESLALAGEEALSIGNIDNIQKLHVKTVELHEHPRRIAHDEVSRTFAVCTMQQVQRGPGAAGGSPSHAVEEGTEVSHIRLLDDTTFELTDTYTLKATETALSVLACTLRTGASEARAFVVGTAFIVPDEPEPTAGRILVLGVQSGRIHLLAEALAKGAVYSLAELQGRVAAGVNNRIEVYAWEEGSALGSSLAGALRSVCVHHGHILALYVETRGDFIVVGDLMKSVSLHLFKADTCEIEDLARDYNSNWVTALDVVDDDTFIAAETGFNLYTVRKNIDAPTDEERQRLDVVGEFHLGEHVNRFRRGSLTMQVTDTDVAPMPTLLFGTVNGVIGVIAQLPEELFLFLAKLQGALAKHIHGVGGFQHSVWRSFNNERKTGDSSGFIDGDLIEQFLDLNRGKQEEIAAHLGIDHDELCKRVEELTRLH